VHFGCRALAAFYLLSAEGPFPCVKRLGRAIDHSLRLDWCSYISAFPLSLQGLKRDNYEHTFMWKKCISVPLLVLSPRHWTDFDDIWHRKKLNLSVRYVCTCDSINIEAQFKHFQFYKTYLTLKKKDYTIMRPSFKKCCRITLSFGKCTVFVRAGSYCDLASFKTASNCLHILLWKMKFEKSGALSSTEVEALEIFSEY